MQRYSLASNDAERCFSTVTKRCCIGMQGYHLGMKQGGTGVKPCSVCMMEDSDSMSGARGSTRALRRFPVQVQSRAALRRAFQRCQSRPHFRSYASAQVLNRFFPGHVPIATTVQGSHICTGPDEAGKGRGWGFGIRIQPSGAARSDAEGLVQGPHTITVPVSCACKGGLSRYESLPVAVPLSVTRADLHKACKKAWLA